MSNTLLEDIKKEAEASILTYQNQPSRIFSDYDNEIETIKSYNGRQIYELLQNAEDAIDKEEHGEVEIILKDNCLTVANMGTPFDLNGFTSLLISNNSSKKGKDTIGNKGLGFRSILNWGKQIHVISAGVHLTFSKEIASKKLKQLMEISQVEKYFQANPEKKGFIATLCCPQIEEIKSNELGKFATKIIVEVRNDYIEDVVNQLKDIKAYDILFLNKMRKLTITTDREYNASFEKSKKGNIVSVKTNIDGKEESYDFKLHTSQGSIFEEVEQETENGHEVVKKERKYQIDLAFDLKHETKKQYYLYNFFKTNIKLPFGFIVNCTFELNADRNSIIIENKINKEMMKILSNEITEFSKELVNLNEDKFLALKVCVPKDIENLKILNLDVLYNELITQIKTSPIIPCYGNVFCNANGLQMLDKFDFSKYIEFDKKDEIAQFSQDETVLNAFKLLNVSPISIEDTYNKIQSQLDKLSTENKAYLLYYYIETYQYNEEYSSHLPCLLVDEYENKIENQPTFAFDMERGEDNIQTLPSFVDFKLLSKIQVKIFKECFPVRDLKLLNLYLKDYNIQPYQIKTIIEESIKQIKDNQDNIKTFIDWAVEYKNAIFKASDLNSIPLPLLNTKGDFIKANEAYFGAVLGSENTEEIIKNVAEEKLIDENFLLQGNEDRKDDLIDILTRFGVSKFPRRIRKDCEDKLEYIQYAFNGNEKVIIEWNSAKFNGQCFSSNTQSSYRINTVKVLTIEFLDEILKKATFKNVLQWLNEDEDLRNLINIDKERALEITVNRPYKSGIYVNLNGLDVKSYIKFKFMNTSWVETSKNGKATPQICCFEDVDMSPYVECPNLDEIEDKIKAKEILHDLGVVEDLKYLSPSVLYKILLNMPQTDRDCKKTAGVYKKVVQANANAKQAFECDEAKEFKKNGLIACRKGNGVKEYKPIEEVYYLDNRIYSEQLISQFHMLDLSKRCGEENVEKLFGVKSLQSINIAVKNKVQSEMNKDFQRDFEEFKPCIHLVCENKNRVCSPTAIKNIKIELVSSIDAEYETNGEKQSYGVKVFDSVFIKEQGKENIYYLKVPNGLDYYEMKKQNQEFCDMIAEIIASALRIEGDRQDYQTLFYRTPNERMQFLSRDFGDEENIGKQLEELKEEYNFNAQEVFWREIEKASSKEKVDEIKSEYEDNINYEELSSLSSLKIIIKLLNHLDLSIDFSDNKNLKIYPKQWYNYILENFKQANINKVKTVLLKRFENSETKEEYFRLVKTFKNYTYIGYSVKEDEIIDELLKVVEINREELTEEFEEEEIDQKEIVFGVNSTHIETKIEENKSQLLLDFNAIDNIVKNIELEDLSTLRASNTRGHKQGNKYGHTGDFSNQAINDKIVGKYAEEVVFKYLKNKDHLEKVNGRSANFEGGQDGLGYDITYQEKGKEETFYVEVKGSKTCNPAFKLTKNELEKAQEDPEHYIIYLLLNISQDANQQLKLIELKNLFKYEENGNFFHNEKFDVTTDSYQITLKTDFEVNK